MESFEDFVSARGDALLRLAWVSTRDRHLAQDLVQEALAKAHLRWGRIEQPETYVRKGILTASCPGADGDPARRSPTDVLPDRPSSGDDPAALTADRDEVLRLLAVLPRQQRAVLVLRYLDRRGDRGPHRLLLQHGPNPHIEGADESSGFPTPRWSSDMTMLEEDLTRALDALAQQGPSAVGLAEGARSRSRQIRRRRVALGTSVLAVAAVGAYGAVTVPPRGSRRP